MNSSICCYLVFMVFSLVLVFSQTSQDRLDQFSLISQNSLVLIHKHKIQKQNPKSSYKEHLNYPLWSTSSPLSMEVNFCRWLWVHNSIEVATPNESEFDWGSPLGYFSLLAMDFFLRQQEENQDFHIIKYVVVEAPTLRSPYFKKQFILYTFTCGTSYVEVIIQNRDEGGEFPISFMIPNLQGVELKYLDVDKQGFAVFKVVKTFRPYILKFQTRVIVPHLVVIYLFVQNKMGKR